MKITVWAISLYGVEGLRVEQSVRNKKRRVNCDAGEKYRECHGMTAKPVNRY